MPIDNKIFRELKKGFEYFEEYDRIGGDPNKRVPICITVPLRMKKQLEKIDNVSRFVENAISHFLT